MMGLMEKRGCTGIGFFALFIVAMGTLFSCQIRTGGRYLERQDLFSLGYGGYGKSLNFSAQGDVLVDFDSREGIFHILDIHSRKVLRLSSYGDILSVLYDPRSSQAPEFIPSTDSGKTAGSEAPGRYAAPTAMTAPSLVAIDSMQTLYVVDKPRAPLSGGSIVRRFGTLGREDTFLGQEGLEGTPFSPIQALFVMDDDSLGIVSSLPSGYLLYRFSGNGTLLTALKMDSAGIALDGMDAYRQNVDGILLRGEGERFEVLLKIDLYGESKDRKSEASAGFDAVESWLVTMDGTSGKLLNRLKVWSKSTNAENPILLGERDKEYVLLQSDSGASGSSVLVVTDKGRVKGRYRMDLPEGVKLVSRLKLLRGDRLAAVAGGKETAHVIWWSLP